MVRSNKNNTNENSQHDNNEIQILYETHGIYFYFSIFIKPNVEPHNQTAKIQAFQICMKHLETQNRFKAQTTQT